MGMSICKDNMKFDIAIFAGGLGTRLLNTESRPKPLVDINGRTLLTRIIDSLEKTNLFAAFHILVCCESEIYNKTLEKEIKPSRFIVYDEPIRSGRIGALKHFLNANKKINKFFVCNGDTLFQNLDGLEITKSIEKFNIDPIIFLVNNDFSRKDYKKVFLGDGLNNHYQNSGLFFMSREWFSKKITKMPHFSDIDEILFSRNVKADYSILDIKVLDAGTPDRLSYIRSIIN